MSVRVFYDILNQKGTPAMYTDTFANRPVFGYQGRLFISTDSGQIFEDTGSAWTLVADAGVGGGTLSSVCLNGNTTATGIVITAGGLSTNSLTDTALTAGSILYAGSGGLISQSNSTFFWDATNNRLGIGNNAPGAPLDIHATGTNAQFNGTGTNNAYLQFQNAGVSKWRIGNTYTGGLNTFDIYNNGLANTTLSFNNSNNNATFAGAIFTNTGWIALKQNIASASTNGYLTLNTSSTGSTEALILGLGAGTTSSLIFSNTGNFTYTLPAVTGTIALLENTNTFTLINTFSSASKYAAGVLFQQNGSYTTLSGYTGIAGVTNGLYIAMGTTAVQGLYFPTGANYGYTFPSASGTVALTSNLSSYLPLTGGTLTGSLGVSSDTTLSGNIGIGYAARSTIRAFVYGVNTNPVLVSQQDGTGDILQLLGQGAVSRASVSQAGIFTIVNLSGTGSRAVLADASGNLSAPVSDISVKQNIKTIGYGLNEIIKMKPVWFDFIDEYKNYGDGRQNGNIAQEMENIIPEAVFTTSSTGKKGINYDQLHAVYIKAIQELNEKLVRNNIN